MHGNVDLVEPGWIRGWARHGAHPDYPLTVHAVLLGVVVASALADIAREDGMPGFQLAVPPDAPATRLAVLVGETGAFLTMPAPARPVAVTVEDLLSLPAPRPWVTGLCWRDAEAAGMRPDTIIDLLCQDFLGCPAEAGLLRAALALGHAEGIDRVRRMLIESPDYRMRRVRADRAPGAMFSKPLVRAVAGRDLDAVRVGPLRLTQVSATPILDLDGADFVIACYRHLLGKEPDAEGMTHYLARLARGDTKLQLIRHIGNELESIGRGIVLIDLPHE
jgi:hypothetical protein